MRRLLPSLLALVLLLEGVAVLPGSSPTCGMPCCKGMGRSACCPRFSTSLAKAGAASDACRLVRCTPESRQSTAPGVHLPAVLAEAFKDRLTLKVDRVAPSGDARPADRYQDPPTPPPWSPRS